jgi:hypothetical protein
VWIAVLGFVKLFPNLEAALKGVFNRVLKNFRKASARSTPHTGQLEKNARHVEASRHPRSLMLVLMSKNKNDANGALRVALRSVAKPGLAIEL